MQRQAAFSACVRTVAESGETGDSKLKLAIKPFVRGNHPRDSKEWKDGPADVALPVAQAIMDEVIKAIAK